ncbi:hypothetical protein PTKIN_Ptkin02bG0031200 [Pterospermum kingtungense]
MRMASFGIASLLITLLVASCVSNSVAREIECISNKDCSLKCRHGGFCHIDTGKCSCNPAQEQASDAAPVLDAKCKGDHDCTKLCPPSCKIHNCINGICLCLVCNSVDRIYFNTPESKSFDEGARLIWDNSSTIDMLEVWTTYKEVDLYVEHKIDVAQPIEETILLTGPPIEMSQAFEAQKPVDQVVEGKNERADVVNYFVNDADIWPEVDCAGLNLGAEGQYKIPEDKDVGVSLGAESQFNDKRLDDRGAGISLGVGDDRGDGVSLGVRGQITDNMPNDGGQFTDNRPDDEVVGVSLGAESQFNDKRPDDRGAKVSLRVRGQITDNMPDDEVAGVSLGAESQFNDKSLDDESAGVEKAIDDELVQDEGEVETSVDDELVEDEGEAVDDDNVYLVKVRYQVDGEGQDDVQNTQNLGNNRAATEGLNENEEGYDIEDDEFHNWTYVGSDVEESSV